MAIINLAAIRFCGTGGINLAGVRLATINFAGSGSGSGLDFNEDFNQDFRAAVPSSE